MIRVKILISCLKASGLLLHRPISPSAAGHQSSIEQNLQTTSDREGQLLHLTTDCGMGLTVRRQFDEFTVTVCDPAVGPAVILFAFCWM